MVFPTNQFFYMSYYSRFYHQPNPPRYEEAAKSTFFTKHHHANDPGQKSAFFQAKLSVNEPGDKYEQEADSVAASVVNQPTQKSIIQQKQSQSEKEKKKKIIPVQAKPDGSGAAASPQVSSKIENSAGKGNPLPQKTLNEMNSSFGTDFSGVKIHHDNEANMLNQELQAQAFTHGNDIYFNFLTK